MVNNFARLNKCGGIAIYVRSSFSLKRRENCTSPSVFVNHNPLDYYVLICLDGQWHRQSDDEKISSP